MAILKGTKWRRDWTMDVLLQLLHTLVLMCNWLIYVIVIAQVPGIYGSKQTESEGVARGRGLFTTAINPWHLCYNYYISHLIGPLLLLL